MSTTTIEEIDCRSIDDRDAAAVADLWSAMQAEHLPDDPPVAAAEVRDRFREAPAHQETLLWVVRGEGGSILASAQLDIRHADDNRTMANADVNVRPPARGRGLATTLLVPMAERAIAVGRPLLRGDYFAGGPGEAFAAAVGVAPTVAEHRNRLVLADLDRDLLTAWVARAAERAAGYSLVAYDDVCPDDLVDEVARVLDAMNDAPMPDSMEDWLMTVEELRNDEAARAAIGTRQWIVCARHDATGELAGITELVFRPHRPWAAYQGDTGVDPAHRERGLGRWLKAVNLLRVLAERPEARFVETWNAGSNEAMLSINHALGFRSVTEWQGWEMDAATLLERIRKA